MNSKEKIKCGRCGKPFVSAGARKKILAAIGKNSINAAEPTLGTCPECRRQGLAERLLGGHLEPVQTAKPPVKRRNDPLQPIKQDSRLGTTVYKSECYICNQGCDAVVHVKDGVVVRVEGDTSSRRDKGDTLRKGACVKGDTLPSREAPLSNETDRPARQG